MISEEERQVEKVISEAVTAAFAIDEKDSYPLGWMLIVDYATVGDPISDSRTRVITPESQILTQSMGQLVVAKAALFNLPTE